MIEVDYETGKMVVETCECKCGAVIALTWGGSVGIESYVIKCAADLTHDTVVPVKSLTQMWKDGEELPSFIEDRIAKKYGRDKMEQSNVKALVTKQDAGKLSTYLQAKFPKDLVNIPAALDFAKFCIAHQLEPIRDCIPFAGNPYITIEWMDRQASGDDKFRGYTYKVYSATEKEALAFDPKDMVAECQAKWDGLDTPLVGLGVISYDERTKKTERNTFRSPVVATHAQQMLFKRARIAALKQRYHVPAPLLEELPYTTVVEAEYKVTEVTTISPAGGEEKFVEATPEQPSTTPRPEAETISSSAKKEKTQKKIGVSAAGRAPKDFLPEDIPDGFTLEKIAFEVWGIQPDNLWQKELDYANVRNFQEAGVETAWDCFLKLKAVYGGLDEKVDSPG